MMTKHYQWTQASSVVIYGWRHQEAMCRPSFSHRGAGLQASVTLTYLTNSLFVKRFRLNRDSED